MYYALFSTLALYLWSGIYPVVWYITYKNNWNYKRFERDWAAVYKLGILVLMANLGISVFLMILRFES